MICSKKIEEVEMDKCFLCNKPTEVKKEAEGYGVNCPGKCGPYLITEPGLIALIKPGRLYDVIKCLEKFRRKDKNRRIRIEDDSMKFIDY